eukprot:9345888-Prorocentrum_lima.AAC.1
MSNALGGADGYRPPTSLSLQDVERLLEVFSHQPHLHLCSQVRHEAVEKADADVGSPLCRCLHELAANDPRPVLVDLPRVPPPPCPMC